MMPLRPSSTIHAYVRTSTLVHSGSMTKAKPMARQTGVVVASRNATGYPITQAAERDDGRRSRRSGRGSSCRARRSAPSRTNRGSPPSKLNANSRPSGSTNSKRQQQQRGQGQGEGPDRKRRAAGRPAGLGDRLREAVVEIAIGSLHLDQARVGRVEARPRSARPRGSAGCSAPTAGAPGRPGLPLWRSGIYRTRRCRRFP